MSRYLPYILVFLLGGTIGYLIGSSSPSSSAPINSSPADTGIETNAPEPPPTPPSIGVLTKNEIPIEDGKPEGKPTIPLPVTTDCISKEEDLSKTLSLISEKMEKDSIWYSQQNPDELRDCSGIFYQVMNKIKQRCDNYLYPNHKKARSSRDIAKWYHKHGNLSLVHDPMVSRELIEPGTVMFFGRSNETYENVTIDLLTGKKGKQGKIFHMGIVTSVERDADGKVVKYVMMHGHRKGKIAHRTHYHGVEPPRLNYPILGNWNQQWVAIANIMTPDFKNIEKPKVAVVKPVEVRPELMVQNTPTTKVTDVKVPKDEPAELAATVDCFSNEELGSLLTQKASQLESQKIMYSQVPPKDLRDCSGIFLRMSNHVKQSCSNYDYPNAATHRNTKSLAKWYYERSNLLIVNDAEKILSELKPGTVMFFGRWGKQYTTLNIDVITGSQGIQHMGVITEMIKNDAGKIIGYVMMHGRSTGKVALRTKHYKNPTPGFSGLGHWQQQLVAIANIMTDKPEAI